MGVLGEAPELRIQWMAGPVQFELNEAATRQLHRATRAALGGQRSSHDPVSCA